MSVKNSKAAYGSVAKAFHWLTALLILTAIPLGLIASNMADRITDASGVIDDGLITRTFLLFSLHKTIGVTVFFVALARILWAVSQPKPGLLHGDRKVEAWAAETVHWLLYSSLVAVPLSGWAHHAATTGFAPIWWPFGQNLPFVPKDPALAETLGALHYVLQWVLIAAIGLHIAGALKHHVIDRDATLRRMLPGASPNAQPSAKQPGHAIPIVAALALWMAALGGGAGLGWFSAAHAPAPVSVAAPTADAAAPQSVWTVQGGDLQIVISQQGKEVAGAFADWSADISYSEAPDAEGRHGAVTTVIVINSLALGQVTSQAMAPDFFNAANFPIAILQADILSDDTGHKAVGELTIRDQIVPVTMPFDLQIDGDAATASGMLTLDRRDFAIGKGVSDPKTLGFEVKISFSLTASRG